MKIRTKQPVFLFDSGGEFVSDLLKMPSDFCIQLVDVVDPCPSHQHDYLEVAYICQGWTQHTLNGKSKKLSAGDFVLVDDKEAHSYDVVGQHLKAVNCMFRPAMIDGALGHCRSFQEVLDSYTLGMGFQQYLRRVRMQMACRLLVESRSLITKIAEECGYEDVKSFRAAFQKETGLPPFQWKQQYASSFHRVF